MMEGILEVGAYSVALLLLAAWRAMPLVAIALLVDLCFRRRLSARYHAVLWSLVVVRLMLPFSLPSEFSMTGPIDRFAEGVLASPETTPQPMYYVESRPADMQVLAADMPEARLAANPTWSWEEVIVIGLLLLWATVASGLLLRTVIAHGWFARQLRKCRILKDPELIDVVLRECDSLRVRRRPKLKEVPQLNSPGVFGLFRPTICLPVGTVENLSAEDLRLVLRHELAHIRRYDAWLLSFAVVMRSLHWFNPFAWLATSRLQYHVEAAADDLALRSLNAEQANAYGRLLLEFAEQLSGSNSRSTPALGFLQFVSGKRLQQRVAYATRKRQPRRRWATAVLISVGIVIVATAMTDASPPDTATQDPIRPGGDWSNISAHAPFVAEEDNGPKLTKVYYIEDLIDKVKEEVGPDVDAILYLKATLGAMGKIEIESFKDSLIVSGTETQQEAIARQLEAFRAGGFRQVMIEIRIIRADVSSADSFVWSETDVENLGKPGSRPTLAGKINEKQLREFIQRTQGDVRSNILMAPKLTMFNGSSAELSTGSQTPFVTHVQQQEGGKLEPVVKVVDEGLNVAMQPSIRADGKLNLGLKLRESRIGEVLIAKLPYKDSKQPSSGVYVQVPEVSTTQFQLSTVLDAGEHILVVAPELVADSNMENANMATFYAFSPRLIEAE